MNFRKRYILVFLIFLALVLILGSGVLWLASAATDAEQTFSYRIAEMPDSKGGQIFSSGLNLHTVSGENKLLNASFEPTAIRTAVTVEMVRDNYLYIAQESPATDFSSSEMAGATVDIVGQGENGQETRLQSQIIDYSYYHFAASRKLQIPTVGQEQTSLSEVAVRQDEGKVIGSLAITKNGTVLADVHTPTPRLRELPEASAKVIALADSGNLFVVLTSDGGIYASSDGEDWNLLRPADVNSPENVWSDIVWYKNRFYIAGPSLYELSPNGTLRSLPTVTGLVGIPQELAVTKNSMFVRTDSGNIWFCKDSADWQSAYVPFAVRKMISSTETDLIFAVGQANQVALAGGDGKFQRQGTGDAYFPGIKNALILAENTWLVLDRVGRLQLTTDGGKNWTQPSTRPLSDLFLLTPGTFLLDDRETGLAQHRFLIEMQLQENEPVESVLPGDICFIQNILPMSEYANAGNPWHTSGSVSWQLDPETAVCGQGYLALNGSTEPAVLMQPLAKGSMDDFTDGKICLLNLSLFGDAEAVNSEKAPEVLLKGPFGELVADVSAPSDHWSTRTATFFLPQEAGSLYPLEFEVRWSGPGIIYLDQIYLGADEPVPHAKMKNALANLQPSVIRLEALELGTKNSFLDSWLQPSDSRYQLRGERWAQTPALNLEDSLRLTLAANSTPWLVISPYVTESDLLNLCEYIAGPASAEYGDRRVRSGTALPWVHQFDRIVIEFSDPEGLYPNDSAGSGYVDRMIRTVSNSPYFDLLKSKLIFIDGIEYSEDLVLSNADFHSSDFRAELSVNLPSLPAGLRGQINDYVTSIPRYISLEDDLRGELTRSFSMAVHDENPEKTLPELGSATVLCATPLGYNTKGMLIDYHDNADCCALAKILGGLEGYYPVLVERIGRTEVSEEGLFIFAFQNENKLRMILVNLTPVLVSYQLNFVGNRTVSSCVAYNTSGESFQLPIDHPEEPIQVLTDSVVVLDLIRNE